mmetsp:Transcript_49295/g.117286  ORF Transcript_49295/g.117286 Transcript_49295/m.117286 type:complete len:642 (+) Transcript_49295:154-2079(+)
MIKYNQGGIWFVRKLFILEGSVFPIGFFIALPCSAVAAILKYLINEGHLRAFEDTNSILTESQAFAGFSFLVGFLIVFRTSQAYSRFWDGCTFTHQMRAEWFDACSALVAFCKHSDEGVAKVERFKGTLIRLFSMLHALALAELEVINTNVDYFSEVNAFQFDVIDPDGLDSETLTAIKYSGSRVELTFSWIQCLVVDNIRTGVLSIPAPILSRAFQEIANGMVAFHDAIKITYIPFPFPYAQTCDCLLVMHWLVAPFVTSQWVTEPVWAAIFVFIQVFIFWCLNLIAIEIENPFGTDPNDLDGRDMQEEMNRHLLLLLTPLATRTPELSEKACTLEDAQQDRFRRNSMLNVWDHCSLPSSGFAAGGGVTTDRLGQHHFVGGQGVPTPHSSSARSRAPLDRHLSRGLSGETLDSAAARQLARSEKSESYQPQQQQQQSGTDGPRRVSFESVRRNLMRQGSNHASISTSSSQFLASGVPSAGQASGGLSLAGLAKESPKQRSPRVGSAQADASDQPSQHSRQIHIEPLIEGRESASANSSKRPSPPVSFEEAGDATPTMKDPRQESPAHATQGDVSANRLSRRERIGASGVAATAAAGDFSPPVGSEKSGQEGAFFAESNSQRTVWTEASELSVGDTILISA